MCLFPTATARSWPANGPSAAAPNQPKLPPWKVAGDELDQIHREDVDPILIVRVEVRPMMWSGGLGKHADDDPEESG
jgi:hypothetical protein